MFARTLTTLAVLAAASIANGQSASRSTAASGTLLTGTPVGMTSSSPQVHMHVFSKRDEKAVEKMGEDLAVMSHLLNRVVSRYPSAVSRSARSVSSPQATYLEGFGVHFELQAPFPLLAGESDKPEQPSGNNSRQLTVWEQARAELRNRQNATATGQFALTGELAYQDQRGDLVARRKNVIDGLLGQLKLAENIEGLGGDDFIAISLTGTPSSSGTFYAAEYSGLRGFAMAARQSTTVTIRVRSRDVARLAAGDLTAEEFRKAAEINTRQTTVRTTPATSGATSPAYPRPKPPRQNTAR